MRKTILFLAAIVATINLSAQTERKDSVVGSFYAPIKEAMLEERIEKSVHNSSLGTFYEPDSKDFRGDFSLEAEQLEINPNALPAKPEAFSIPNLSMSSSHEEVFGLADIRRADIAYGWSTGRWLFTAMASGEKYKFQNVSFNNFLLGGSATYQLSPHWLLTAFGQYSTGRYFHSMAAYPYISQSNFGASLNYRNEKFGMRLGARQYYDPLRRQWQTEPIIAPQFKVGKLPVEVDFGPLARKILERAILGNRNEGPIIMPPGR